MQWSAIMPPLQTLTSLYASSPLDKTNSSSFSDNSNTQSGTYLHKNDKGKYCNVVNQVWCLFWWDSLIYTPDALSSLPNCSSLPSLIHLLLKISTTHPATPLGQSYHKPDAPCRGKRILQFLHPTLHNTLPPVHPWLIQQRLKRLLGY